MISDQAAYDLLEKETHQYHYGNRTASTALLAWFLQTVWRLEPEEASDAICDGGGDKGIDALAVDDDLMEITVFQSKHRTSAKPTQGDADLRAFVGVSAYFRDGDGIEALLSSGPNVELRKLVERLNLRRKLSDHQHTIKLVFVTNALLDVSGADFAAVHVNQVPPLDVWDRRRLSGVAERTQSLQIQELAVTLPLASGLIHEQLGETAHIAVALIPATELVRLPGVEDLSIFDLNVRLALGKTRINKELATTISQPEEHALFPAYHNGLTLLSRRVKVYDGEMQLDGVSVVNGCQSLMALYNNRQSITPGLNVLVKIIELGDSLDLVDQITYRTNNQNPVNARDLRSTDPIQRDLQAQVRESYGSELGYIIRNGEKPTTPEVIDNSTAAQLAMAVYVGEPWNAVRKVKLFDEEYHRIFNRTFNGHKLYLLHIMNQLAVSKRSLLRDDLEASFASVRFTLLHLLAKLTSFFDLGAQFMERPERWLTEKREEVVNALAELTEEVIDSINYYIESREGEAKEQGLLFDPKVVFKSKVGVQAIERDLLQQARRLSRRDPSYGFHVSPAY